MNEQLIIEGLKKGDSIVFDYLFNYYYSSLCAYTMQFINDKVVVEDLVQDFFVTLWVESSKLQIRSSLKSYLFVSIKNRCLDYQKHQKVIEKYKLKTLLTPKEENSVELYFAESELRQIIQRSLEKLPPRCREIFELNRINGLSNQEISEKLGISKRTVELQISNSLKILRKELVDFLPLFIVLSIFK